MPVRLHERHTTPAMQMDWTFEITNRKQEDEDEQLQTTSTSGRGWGTSKHNCLVSYFIMLTTTCFGHCGPSSGHKNVYTGKLYRVSYVYWTVHHLHSWVERDQLDVTCFFISLFNAQHVSDVNTSILRSLRLICWAISWVVLLWYDVCWCYVVVWLGWCGIRMQAEVCIRIPHHPSQTTT